MNTHAQGAACVLALTLAAPATAADVDVRAAGSRHALHWDAASFPSEATVSVQWSADGGNHWEDLGTGPNNGRFVWTVPDRTTTDARLRVHAGDTTAAVLPSGGRFAVGPSRALKDYEWVALNRAAPFAPRDGAGVLSFKDRIWLLGGWNQYNKQQFPRDCVNDVWSSADGQTWNMVRPNTFLDDTFDSAHNWEGRHTAGYVVFKDRIWIVGGDVNQGHYHDDVWASSDGVTWEHVNAGKPVPWGPRALHYTVAFDGKIWVMGGQTIPQFAAEEEVFYRDIWNSSDGVNWERVTPEEPFWPQRGMIGGSAVHDGRMWVLGGGTYDTPDLPTRKYFNDVWSSADGVRWTQHLADAPWHPRQYHEVAAFDGRIWVLEGFHQNGGNRNDVWYSDDGVNWYELQDTPWPVRHAASVTVHDGGLWVIAGNGMHNDVWKLRRTPSH